MTPSAAARHRKPTADVDAIKTYSMAERMARTEFCIHDERRVTRLSHPHRHEYFQVHVHISGHTKHYIGATAHTLGPGSISFVSPFRVHRTERSVNSKFFIVNFHQAFLRPELRVDPLDLEDVPIECAPELSPFLYQEFMDFTLHGRDFDAARSACETMAEEDGRGGFCSTVLIRAQLLSLIGTVCSRYEDGLLQLARDQAQRTSRRDALTRIVRYVREHLAGRVTLAEAAAAAHLSPNYVMRLLKKETGKTFTDLVTARRMEKARELLRHTSLRIGDVA